MNRKWIIGLVAVIVTTAAIFSFLYLSHGNANIQNQAKDTARYIESTLINSGAIKRCETSAARGSDNHAPWYSANFEVPQNRQKTIDMVISAASANGYGLAHASKENPGPIAAVDPDNWFYDLESRDSGYSDLKPGKVRLLMSVKNEPMELSHISCGTAQPVKMKGDVDNSIIYLEVYLPEFKSEAQ